MVVLPFWYSITMGILTAVGTVWTRMTEEINNIRESNVGRSLPSDEVLFDSNTSHSLKL
jgi:hypothetical protein